MCALRFWEVHTTPSPAPLAAAFRNHPKLLQTVAYGGAQEKETSKETHL